MREAIGMTEGALLEMTGTIEQIIYRNEKNGYTILDLNVEDELVVVVGTMPFVGEGEELHVIGKWVNHPTFGDQFKVETFERAKPATATAMLKYLSSGAIKGIGKRQQQKLWRHLEKKLWKLLKKSPIVFVLLRELHKKSHKALVKNFSEFMELRELNASSE